MHCLSTFATIAATVYRSTASSILYSLQATLCSAWSVFLFSGRVYRVIVGFWSAGSTARLQSKVLSFVTRRVLFSLTMMGEDAAFSTVPFGLEGGGDLGDFLDYIVNIVVLGRSRDVCDIGHVKTSFDHRIDGGNAAYRHGEFCVGSQRDWHGVK